MLKNFDEVQKLGKDGVDGTIESLTAASKGTQALTAEWADYARKSFEQGTASFEKLIAARTLDRAFEVQTEFAEGAYEGFVAEPSKGGEWYADLAKQAYKPFESYAAKVGPVA